jgi:hypothetical protein
MSENIPKAEVWRRVNAIREGRFEGWPEQVDFELSNRCNLAYFHEACPAFLKRGDDPEILDTRIILDVCKWLGEIGYSGRIIFSIYNETMIDPRLFWLVEKIAVLAPKATMRCLSNGWYLNQHLVDLLWQCGVKSLHLTAYSEEDDRRMRTWKIPEGMERLIVPTYGDIRKLDKRRQVYDMPVRTEQRQECYEPFAHIMIRATGQVGFCCLDWDNRHAFASLHDTCLQEIIAGPEMLEAFKATYEGPKSLHLCQRCFWGKIR